MFHDDVVPVFSRLFAFLLCSSVAFGAPKEPDATTETSVSVVGADATVLIRGGGRLYGTVLKQTERLVYLDVGFTLLPIPREEILEVVSSVEAQSPAVDEAPGLVADSRGIFSVARGLRPGTIEEKAREVGDGVVQILCLGKSGSGFVVDGEAGYVLTNFHVVEGESNISVVIFVREDSGFRRVKLDSVRIVALNPFFDLGLLKIEDRKGVELQDVYLGEYATVRVGDPVFAIGSPLGLDRTVSEGIVSNRSRAISGLLSIQTTAPINPGNSGGPLFNNRGEVIGITSSGILFAQNLGFAIPIHYVKDFLRNRDAFAYDKDNPNNGIRYMAPPRKTGPGGDSEAGTTGNLENETTARF